MSSSHDMLFWDEEGSSEVWSFVTIFIVLEKNPEFANSAKGINAIVGHHFSFVFSEHTLVFKVLNLLIIVNLNLTGFLCFLDWVDYSWVAESPLWLWKLQVRSLRLLISGLFVFDWLLKIPVKVFLISGLFLPNCGKWLIAHYCKRVAIVSNKISTRLINSWDLDRITKQ